MATMEVLQQQLADALAERDTLEQTLQAVTAERDAARVWQGRCSDLVNLIDPLRSFKAGEFEALDDNAWAALVAELRGKALTDEKLADVRQRELTRQQERMDALAKLTTKEREALGV